MSGAPRRLLAGGCTLAVLATGVIGGFGVQVLTPSPAIAQASGATTPAATRSATALAASPASVAAAAPAGLMAAAASPSVKPAPVRVTQATCPRTGSTPVPPSLALPPTTAKIGYVATPSHGWHAGMTVTVTAQTVGRYRFAARLPGGWHRVNATLATRLITLVSAPICVTPAVPALTQATCARSGATVIAPTLTLPRTGGVNYQVSKPAPYQGGEHVTVSARAQPGRQFDTGAVPGWTRVSGTFERYPVIFAATPTCVPTSTPGFTDDVCVHSIPTTAGFTLPPVPGLFYVVDSIRTAPGSYTTTDGSTVTVRAEPRRGVTLVGRTVWTHKFATTPSCAPVQSAAPVSFISDSCSSGRYRAGSYSIPDSTVAEYLLDGKVVAPGSHRAAAPAMITIVAMPLSGYRLDGVTSWTHTFGSVTTCASAAGRSAGQPSVSGSGSEGIPALADTGTPASAALMLGLGLVGCGVALVVTAGRRRRPSDTGRASSRPARG